MLACALEEQRQRLSVVAGGALESAGSQGGQRGSLPPSQLPSVGVGGAFLSAPGRLAFLAGR